jgi:hypothetical protein
LVDLEVAIDETLIAPALDHAGAGTPPHLAEVASP